MTQDDLKTKKEKNVKKVKKVQDVPAETSSENVDAVESVEKVDKKSSKKKGAAKEWKRVRHARSKRYVESRELIDATKQYSLDEAIALAKKTSTVSFDASVEVHVRLGIDGSKSDQMVRGSVELPHGTGRTKRVAAFVSEDKQKEAKEAGADIVGGQELITKIVETGKCDFDIAVATPDMMRFLGKIGKILGQKGLMPNPKTETVSPDPAKTIRALLGGKESFKSDGGGNVHQLVGRVSFGDDQLKQNVDAFLDVVKKTKPDTAKGEFVQKVVLTTSMGPGIRVEVSK
jgi:large subunit ribosomal protein L1